MDEYKKFPKVEIKRLPNCFALPEYKTAGAAAMDLYAAEDVVIHSGEVVMVPTGIAIALPPGYEAQIRARSGMAAKGVIVTNAPGTIDCDYRGEIKILLATVVTHFHQNLDAKCKSSVATKNGLEICNLPKDALEHRIHEPCEDYRDYIPTHQFENDSYWPIPGFQIKRGDRIAQMLIARCYQAALVEVEELDKTERGDGGFGSTGAR